MTHFPNPSRGPLDMHVHVVGNGLSGSGCWSKLNSYRRVLAGVLLRGIGLDTPMRAPDFDDRYAAHLAGLVGESSLSHAAILAHDEVYGADGRKLRFGSFHTSNDWVLTLARRHPCFLPVVSIHPARPDALRELDRCIGAGAVMLKLLPPSHNVDCSLRAYEPFWRRMAEAGLPLLAHTGGEYTVPVVDKSLFDPARLRLPLDCGVTVIAAHAASRSAPAWMEKDHLPAFLGMLVEYPRLFADNSALNTPNRSHALRVCLAPGVMHRVVHGSDFPVPVSGRWASWRRLVPPDAARRAAGIGNPLERDYQLKVAMGFEPEVFTRAWQLLRRA